MNKYRDLYLKDINKNLIENTITVSGWVNDPEIMVIYCLLI